MMRNVYTKTLYDKRWFMAGWFLGFMFLSLLMVTFYPAMHQDGSLDQLMKSMPAALQGFVGDLNNLREFSTYLASQLFDIRLQILTGVMVVILALSITVAEEESRQLRTVTSLALSRTSILWQKWAALATIVFIALLGVPAGILLFQGTIGEAVSFDILLRLFVMAWLTVVALGTVTFSIGIGTGLKPVATGLGILLLAGSFIVTTFATGVEWLQEYEMWSLFYYFPPVEVVKDGIRLENVAVLICIILIPLTAALIRFRQRDIVA